MVGEHTQEDNPDISGALVSDSGSSLYAGRLFPRYGPAESGWEILLAIRCLSVISIRTVLSTMPCALWVTRLASVVLVSNVAAALWRLLGSHRKRICRHVLLHCCHRRSNVKVYHPRCAGDGKLAVQR